MRACVLGAFASLVYAAVCGWAAAQERIDVPVRPGVVEPVYASTVAKPTANLILFPGGNGVYATLKGNFLVRSVPDLTHQGVSAFVVDAPSDHGGGMSWTYRVGAEHAADIGAIVAMVKARSPAPVWLVGTSRGSISAANGAIALGTGVAGVVLTSSVWADGMAGLPLDRIRVPVLLVHSRDDGCQESPFVGAENAMQHLTGAPAHALIAVSGGLSRGDACQGKSAHGYLGIEPQVIGPMLDWIRTH